MAKAKFKDLLIDKGERYALYISGGVMLLLFIAGILNLADTPDPEEIVKSANSSAQKIKTNIDAPKATPEPLESYATTIYVHKQIHQDPYVNRLFDPVGQPDTRRINPQVLAVRDDIHADFLWAKILAFDIRTRPDGTQEIGVLVHKGKKEEVDKNAVKDFINNLRGRKQPSRPKKTDPNPDAPKGPMGPMGGGPGLPAPAMPSMPGGPKMGGSAGGPKMGGPGGPRPGGPKPGSSGGMQRGGEQNEGGDRLGIIYVPLDSDKLEGMRLALTIYPQRMVVVQAAFPYKEQLKEMQNALRLEKLTDVLNPENAPQFRGFVVERQILDMEGKVSTDWQPLDVLENYRQTIFPRKFADKDEEPALQFVELPQEHHLVMPLPFLLAGNYPPVRSSFLLKTIQELQQLNKPIELPKGPQKLKGQGDLFAPTKPNQAGLAGQPSSGDGFNIPKMKGKEQDAGNKSGSSTTVSDSEIPEYVLVRVLDNDVLPGRYYRYRIKLKMTNPNWVGEKDAKGVPEKKNKYDLVSRPSDADVEEIEGRFVEMKGVVTVPPEDFLFASDPIISEKDPKKSHLDPKPGQALLQYQRWMAQAAIRGYKEPVGDWIVADVLVKRGTRVGGKQFVNLPLWSSEYNRYILREEMPEKGSRSKEMRRGVVMDPTQPGPQFLVVDIDGGKMDAKTLTKTISEEAASEILLLDEEGNLQVRCSARDRTNAERAKREELWRQWVEKTEKDTTSLVPNAGGKGPDFN